MTTGRIIMWGFIIVLLGILSYMFGLGLYYLSIARHGENQLLKNMVIIPSGIGIGITILLAFGLFRT